MLLFLSFASLMYCELIHFHNIRDVKIYKAKLHSALVGVKRMSKLTLFI